MKYLIVFLSCLTCVAAPDWVDVDFCNLTGHTVMLDTGNWGFAGGVTNGWRVLIPPGRQMVLLQKTGSDGNYVQYFAWSGDPTNPNVTGIHRDGNNFLFGVSSLQSNTCVVLKDKWTSSATYANAAGYTLYADIVIRAKDALNGYRPNADSPLQSVSSGSSGGSGGSSGPVTLSSTSTRLNDFTKGWVTVMSIYFMFAGVRWLAKSFSTPEVNDL